MAIGNLKYARPSDLIESEATWSATAGTVSSDPDYDLSALAGVILAQPTKFIDEPIVAVRVVGDFGTARRVDGLALPNSNIDAGAVLLAELGNDPTFATHAVSVPMTMGARHLDGHRASPWADFTTASGYSVAGFRYVSLQVPVNSLAPWLGPLLVAEQLREFERWPTFDGTKGARRPFPELLTTEYGIQRGLRRKIKQRTFRFPFNGTDADYAALQALADDTSGISRAFLCIADSGVKTDGALFGRFTEETAKLIAASEAWFDLNRQTIEFVEDSRSLPFP